MGFKRGQFSINNHHSSEFNVSMSERPQRLSTGRVVELRPRPGNHSLVLDHAYYQNVVWKIKCYAKVKHLEDVSNQEDLIREWLDMESYSDFHYFFDEAFIYQAIVLPESLIFTGARKHGNLIPFEFSISLQPMKETFVGRQEKELKNNEKLHNPRKYHSKPRIHIFGKGDISFYINNQKFSIKGLESDIIIDSKLEESFHYKNGEVLFLDDKTIFNDFPELEKGWSEIKWTGNVSNFLIIPRWVAKV